MLLVSRFQNFLCPGSDDGSGSRKMECFKSVLSIKIAESKETETHLSIKLSKKDFI